MFKYQTEVALIGTAIAEDRKTLPATTTSKTQDQRSKTKPHKRNYREEEEKKSPPFLLKREVGQNVLSFPLFLRLLCTKASLRSPETW